MTQINLDPYFLRDTVKQHEQLIEQHRMEKLVRESTRHGKPRNYRIYTVLALVGRSLVGLGSNLEARFSIETESQSILNQQDNPGGCI